MKRYSKIIIFAIVFIVILLLVLFMNRSGFKSNDETTSEFYESFISSVQTLNKALDTVSEASGDEKSVSMFDVYTYMLFVNQRLNFFIRSR